MLNAIVLAGSANKGSLQQYSTVQKEALIKISGRSMVEYVLEALDNTTEIAKLVLVGVDTNEVQYQVKKAITCVPAGTTLLESIELGTQALPQDQKVLLVTADIPLLQAKAVVTFIAQCESWQADLYYPIISRELCEKRFPGVKRTYASFLEGTYTGGNIFLLQPAALAHCKEIFEVATTLRKSPLRLSRLLGTTFLFKFMCRRLSMIDIEAKLQEVLGIKAKIIVSENPEIGVDVDKPGDFQLVEHEIAKRSSGWWQFSF